MSSSPSRPGRHEVTSDEKRVLEERDKTLAETAKSARPAEDVIKDIRQKLKPAPRP